jgi:hypothetical protein
MSFKDGEALAENEIKLNRFDLEFWNNFLENPENFKKLFSKNLINKSDEPIEGYRSYYSAYLLLVDTKSDRDNLPTWRTPWKNIKKKKVIINDISQ